MHLGYRLAIFLACAMGLALAPAEPVGAADRSHQIVFKKTTPDDEIWPAILKGIIYLTDQRRFGRFNHRREIGHGKRTRKIRPPGNERPGIDAAFPDRGSGNQMV